MSRVPALAPFRVSSFRFQWPADLATSWAFEMEILILAWYILVETQSVFLLAAFGSLQFFGTLVAPVFGVVGDRIGHRNLLCLMRAVFTLLAVLMAALILTGELTPERVFAIGLVSGLVRPSDLVMRNAIIGETMQSEQLMRAMSLSRSTADSARVAGALAGASLATTLGMGTAYLTIIGFYVLSLLLTLRVAAAPATTERPVAGRSPWRDLSAGIAYAWVEPHLRATMLLAFLINLTAYPLFFGLLPHVVKNVYHLDQTGLGWLAAGFALGALIGSVGLTAMGAAIRPSRTMLIWTVVWYLLALVFAWVETWWIGLILMLLTGFAQSLAMVPMSVMLLRTINPAFRGRVMGVRMLAVYGLPVGLLAGGPLIEQFGFAVMATLYAVIGLVFTLWLAARWRHDLWRIGAASNL